ncbi:cation diffusion facilitator family transporter [Pallidibacillus pasinlerensis]|uniref:Cation transporter n=1 Tax=Pallidibacillus pasinlerensis TaxID=2703818 RepID=A0ABX0A7F4_9BACI|nr:cation diffusion facilitator family transporter [Pallidibacillus pasinlerensis]NCU18414.1 cation transporter [Pallidibacillus pasinlerensis]
MIKFLIKHFIPNYENTTDTDVREKYGVLSGIVGIICNVLLFIIKLVIGLIVNSIAIISDAFNNLTDSATSIITIIGAKLSNRPPDKEHPFGHGRYEYIASLLVAFLIFAVGWQLLGSSVNEIFNPQPVDINILAIVILSLSILIKVWMYSYNTYIGKTINSGLNIATAKDSLNDVITTSGVIIGTVIGLYVDLPIDGIIGLIISLLIMYTGFSTAKDTVNFLLGPSPDPEISEKIEKMVAESKVVTNCHQLRIHDYGPGKHFASMHVDVPAHISVEEAHSLIHQLEEKIKKELGIDIVIHIDPSKNI